MADVHSEYAAMDGDIMPDGTPAPPVARRDDAAVRVSEPLPAQSVTEPFFNFNDDDDASYAPDRDPRKLRRNIIAGVAALVIVAIGATLLIRATHPPDTPLQFTTTTVVRDNLTVTTSATGQISSGVYNLNFFTSGKIAEIDVSAGQNVSAGQVLAKLDTTALQDALNSAQQGLNSAQTSLNNAYTSQRNSDAIAWDNYQKALASAKTTQDQQAALDQYNQSIAQAQAQVDSAVQQYHNAQNQLTSAQHNFANATLTAPVAGQIASVNGQVGVAAGSGSSAFIVLVNLTDLAITAPVNEADIGNIQPGQPVSFTVQAFPSDTFFGTVASISPVGTTTQNVVTYPVTVNIDPKSAQQERLFPGMTAQLTVTTKQVIDALLVPNTALSYARTAVRAGRVTTAQVQQALAQAQQLITNATDDSVKQGTASYVLEQQNGKVVAVPVVTGFSNGTDTVIMSGLNENDTVLTGDNKTATTTSSSSTTTRNRGGAGGIFGGGR